MNISVFFTLLYACGPSNHKDTEIGHCSRHPGLTYPSLCPPWRCPGRRRCRNSSGPNPRDLILYCQMTASPTNPIPLLFALSRRCLGLDRASPRWGPYRHPPCRAEIPRWTDHRETARPGAAAPPARDCAGPLRWVCSTGAELRRIK
jgi:hypothetical protein